MSIAATFLTIKSQVKGIKKSTRTNITDEAIKACSINKPSEIRINVIPKLHLEIFTKSKRVFMDISLG
ncbi:hypothetical protein IW15_02855 [Chryseobacterium soli]|uniref:Uncharacterized protein n=1 Tax=Chryseobacterium soli TaxID=445961 RepID=A0A086ACI3_9FLAO|nr:hypothetical protein IW15_02855 [Chryseobacterium soli]